MTGFYIKRNTGLKWVKETATKKLNQFIILTYYLRG